MPTNGSEQLKLTQMQLKSFLKGMSNVYSLLVVFVFALSINTIINSERLYKRDKNSRLFELDSGGYFNYLPATFVYDQDYRFQYIDKHQFASNFLTKTKTGNYNKYAIGVAILLSPFYLVAHWLNLLNGNFPADGFSQPYQHGVLLGALFYAVLGLYCIRKLLLRYFSDPTTAITLVIIAFGSNLLYYTTYEGCMSHIYSFFLFALSLILTDSYWKSERRSTFLLLSMVIGFIGLVRLPNLVFMIVPLLWAVKSKSDIQDRIESLTRNKATILLGFLIFSTITFIQFYAYKIQVGTWFTSPYQGEGFFWDQPMMGRVLFSYRKGWLVYTPLMVMPITGMIWMVKKKSEFLIPVISFFIINLYVVSCWWNWWYGGSYGMRALIESMAVMSIPIAIILESILSKKTLSYIFTAVLPLLICYNFVTMHQYKHGIIHYDSMSKASYWAIFGTLHPAAESTMTVRNNNLSTPTFYFGKEGKKERKKIR